MAMLNGTTSKVPKSHIEGMQSIPPLKMTDPRRFRHVSINELRSPGIFRRCLHTILCYKKASREDSGWVVAGWIKESLGTALLEQPLLAGRLRLVEDGGGLEIVSNDSGIRLVEARISRTLAEFLDLKEIEEDAEAELVFWKDIDEQSPQFSPLFYVQVTNFQCGGYSIGLSCSLLLADPLVITNFLKKWTNIHNNLVPKSEIPTPPTFYLPNLKPQSGPPTNPMGPNQSTNHGLTMIFKIPNPKNLNFNDGVAKKVAFLCIEKLEHKLGVKMASNFSLIVKEPSEIVKVENCSTQEEHIEKQSKFISGIKSANWVDLGANEVEFYEGNKPEYVSYWINSVSEEGLVMVVPDQDEGIIGIQVFVTVPNKKKKF